MDSVAVKKTATQFVPGNPDYWSILVFFENGKDVKPKPTEDGKSAKSKPAEKSITINEEDLTEDEKIIFSALKLWRKDRALDINQPEYIVCHNATLMHIAKEKPRDLIALSKIKGMGDHKVATYGEDVIAIINAF